MKFKDTREVPREVLNKDTLSLRYESNSKCMKEIQNLATIRCIYNEYTSHRQLTFGLNKTSTH